MDTPPAIGQIIRRYRVARGLTLRQLAESTGAGESQLSRIETGATQPHPATLQRIASALSLPPAALLAQESAMSPPTTGFFSLSGVTPQLEVTDLEVQRLIARKRLPAVRLGDGGPWRIAVSAVETYIASGCPDLHIPKLDGSWFSGQDRNIDALFVAFRTQIAAALEEQLPPDDQPPAPPDGQHYIPLRLTPPIANLCRQPASAPWPDQVAGKVVDVRMVYLAQRLRFEGRTSTPKRDFKLLAQLYESPGSYAAVVAAATEKVLAGTITIVKSYVLRSGLPDIFSFGLPVKSIAPSEAIDAAVFLAF